MINIFLSYSHADLQHARRLYNTLDSIPTIKVWFDKESLLPGQRWENEIRKAIRNSRFFLLLLSNNSTSKRGFYQREIRLALQVLEEYPNEDIFLIPIRLDECELHFEQLTDLQYVDLFPNWEMGINKILHVLQIDKNSATNETNYSKVRFTSHQARFVAGRELHYFLNATNLGKDPIEFTHLWYEDGTHHIPVRCNSRPLPKRLAVNEVWSSWISVNSLPELARNDAYGLFRLRLSSGEILTSIKDDNIPPYGSVAGGPILTSDIRQAEMRGTISILFLSADPADATRLHLSKEFREIQEQLKVAKLRERFRLELPQLSVRPVDISQALLDVQPHIVHFSGHGTSSGALCFESRVGETHLVQADVLADLFLQFANQVHCVILNACYSEIQANAIANHINYVIGMSQAIDDNAAIAFSVGFYQALGAGRSIEDAYKLGIVQIRLQGISEHLTPVLIKKGQEQR
jgi:hypothetical protein